MRSWSATRNVWLSMNSPQKSQKILLPVARLYVTARAVHKLTTLGGCSGIISQPMVTLFLSQWPHMRLRIWAAPLDLFWISPVRTGREPQSRFLAKKNLLDNYTV